MPGTPSGGFRSSPLALNGQGQLLRVRRSRRYYTLLIAVFVFIVFFFLSPHSPFVFSLQGITLVSQALDGATHPLPNVFVMKI